MEANDLNLNENKTQPPVVVNSENTLQFQQHADYFLGSGLLECYECKLTRLPQVPGEGGTARRQRVRIAGFEGGKVRKEASGQSETERAHKEVRGRAEDRRGL